MLQPVEQPAHTLGVSRKNQTRFLYRKSLLHNAPTGHISTTLPDNLFSSGSPGKMSISAWSPRLTIVSSADPAISRVNRTHREHMIQRSVKSVIFELMCGLLGGVFFRSIIRLSA